MPRPMTPQFEPDCLEPSNDGILIDMDPRHHKQHQLSLTYEEPSEERVQQILETARRINGTPKPADRKSTRLNSSHIPLSRMPSSA